MVTAAPIIPTCYWWRDGEQGDWILIPGCMARANDPRACTCNVPESKLERERGKRRAAEAIAERLRDKLHGALADQRAMLATVKHWRRVLERQGIDPSKHNATEAENDR